MEEVIRLEKTNIEFRKGYLFVRINGSLNNLEYKSNKIDISNIIKKLGIKYLVLHFNKISLYNTKLIINNYKEIMPYGKLIICGPTNKKILNNKNILKINNEIDAFKLGLI